MHCSSCDTENRTDAQFCDHCGASLLKVKYCRSCKKENRVNAKYCDSCGKPFSQHGPSKAIKISIFNVRNTFAFCVGALILLGFAFIIFNIYKKNSEHIQTATNLQPLQSQDQSVADQTTIVQSDKLSEISDSRGLLTVPSFDSNLSESAKQASAGAKTTEKGEAVLLQSISEIRKKINKSWVRPSSAPSGIKCKVRVRLSSNGNIVDTQVVSSSGNSTFDRSAVNAIKSASPLPVPANKEIFAKNFRVFTFTFEP